MKSSRLKPLIFLAIPLAVGGLAALFSAGSMDKFSALNQPPLSPSRLAVSNRLGHIIYSHGHGIVYSLQLGCAGDKQAESTRTLSRPARVQFSLADTVFTFGLCTAAAVLIVILWVLILLTLLYFYRISKTAGYLIIPYLLWVTFAAYLNIAICIIN